jgi:peptidoglycan/LPS O-acetylase OafA/YrhL
VATTRDSLATNTAARVARRTQPTPSSFDGPASADGGSAGSGRIIAIDITRGFAICWVVLYHVWSDLRFPNVYPQQGDAFRAVPHRFADGNFVGGLTAIGDAFFRVGYLGVPLFMMLSGLSLTIAALRRGPARQRVAPLLMRRLRRVMIPYWAGLAITLTFASALAFVQWQRHGGASYLDFLQRGDINVDGNQLFAGTLLAPRIFRDEWQFAPEGSLWFVLLIVQYYLLFPVLLVAMKRVGPRLFLAATLVVTLASLTLMTVFAGDLVEHRSWVEMGAPFRLFEFGLGMTIGWLLVRRPTAFDGIVRAPMALASAMIGAAVFVAACLIAPDAQTAVLQGPAIVLGLALMFAPLIAKTPGWLEASAPGRALAWIGVISYTVLIVSEPLRSVTHTMSAEGAADGWIVLWAIAGFVPLTLLLARPLAMVLGLVERESRVTVGELVGRSARGGDR